MKDILFKFPQYSFLSLAESLAEVKRGEQLSKNLVNSNSWYKIPTAEYKEFMLNWSGEPLDIVEAHDYYSWLNTRHYYVYTTESRRVLARIKQSDNQTEYFIALNA